MNKSLYIALITLLAVFCIRILYQVINIKRQTPQTKKISEALQMEKEVNEGWKSVVERMCKKGTGNNGGHLPSGVVEITFNEYSSPTHKVAYVGPYEIYLIYSEKGQAISGRGRRILEGNCSGDGSPVKHKLSPGRYLIRIHGRDVGEEFTIYELDTQGRRLTVAVPPPGKSRYNY